MDVPRNPLGPDDLQRFQALQPDAVSAVTNQFFAQHGSAYERFGARGREACREDLAFHLEFLRPVLEFGFLQPMVDYLRWLDGVLGARGIATEHVGVSLRWLGMFYAEKMKGASGDTVKATLRVAWESFLDAKSWPAAPAESLSPWAEAEDFETALLCGRQDDALKILHGCLDDGRGLVGFERSVIQPSLSSIGEKWQLNQVTVAQEHMASAIVQSVMTIGLLRSPPPLATGKRVMLACVAGNHHSIGLRMVCDAFQLSGWDVQYLGANVPTPSLIKQVHEWRPDLVGLSVSFPQQLRVAREIISQLVEQLGDGRPAVIIGGLAINRFENLAERVGADAHGVDAQAALRYAQFASVA
jgi:MerR family transcriptional regulator, light-induced transcriptional regulator